MSHVARRLVGSLVRFARVPVLTLVLIAGLTGCRHKPPTFVIPGAQAPVALEVPPAPEPLPLIATVPAPELALAPAPMPMPPPRKRPSPAPKEDAQPPVQIAEAPALAIGTLSTGGDPTPQTQHEAQDTIASILKRIAAFSAKTSEAEKRQIRQVRHFIDQAQQALNSGDAEGAQNLATKARLLMDDLEKR